MSLIKKSHLFFFLLGVVSLLGIEESYVLAASHDKYTNQDDNRTGNVKKVSDNLYVGEAVLKNGQKIYFGYEKITENNQKGLQGYHASIRRMHNPSRGMLEVLSILKNRANYDDIKELVGLAKNDFDALIAILRDRNLKENKGFRGITTGAGYFTTTMGNYFAYISAKPIEGAHNFGGVNSGSSVKDYLEQNKDLIMFVGSDQQLSKDKISDCYINRGIFRTSHSFLYGGDEHKGLSLALHGFIAFISKTFFKKKRMCISDVTGGMSIMMKRKNLIEDLLDEPVLVSVDVSVDKLIPFYLNIQ